MKLPRDLGGMNVPDISLQYQVLRTSWIKACYDFNNKADWKPLAGLLIESLTNTPGIGKDIITFPKRYPKVSSVHFWTTNLKAFKYLQGYTTDNLKNVIYTPVRAINETLTTFTDISSLMKSGINKLEQVATVNNSDCSIELHTPRTNKSENKLKRVMSKRTWDRLKESIPSNTIPPTHILTEDHKSCKILEIIQTTNNEYSAVPYRPITTNQNFNEINFEISDSPIRPFKRLKSEEEKEIVIEKLSRSELCLAPDPTPTGPTVNPLSRLYLSLNNISIPLQNTSLTFIYDQAIRWKMKLPHQHSIIYETHLEIKPNWSNIPNRRPHQCIPAKVKDIRLLTVHNSIKIGRQLIHIPDIEPVKIKCHNCDEEENNILHMFIYCPVTNNAWNYLQDKWQSIIGSYEDFIDPPDFAI